MSGSTTPVIAIDAMGGDIGLDTTLVAVARAQNQYNDVRFILVGDESAIKTHKSYSLLNPERFQLHHAEQVVAMDEKPSTVLRHKRQSSLWKALELVRDGQAQACVSAAPSWPVHGPASKPSAASRGRPSVPPSPASTATPTGSIWALMLIATPNSCCNLP